MDNTKANTQDTETAPEVTDAAERLVRSAYRKFCLRKGKEQDEAELATFRAGAVGAFLVLLVAGQEAVA